MLLFLYRYFFRLGFLDGETGLIYCGFQAVQMFHTKAKIYEQKIQKLKIYEPQSKKAEARK